MKTHSLTFFRAFLALVLLSALWGGQAQAWTRTNATGPEILSACLAHGGTSCGSAETTIGGNTSITVCTSTTGCWTVVCPGSGATMSDKDTCIKQPAPTPPNGGHPARTAPEITHALGGSAWSPGPATAWNDQNSGNDDRPSTNGQTGATPPADGNGTGTNGGKGGVIIDTGVTGTVDGDQNGGAGEVIR